jgi:hypothetical protein
MAPERVTALGGTRTYAFPPACHAKVQSPADRKDITQTRRTATCPDHA